MQSLASKHTSPADADTDGHRAAAVRGLLSAIADGGAVLTLDGADQGTRKQVVQAVAATLQGAGVRVLHIDAAAHAGGGVGLRDVLAQVAGQETGLDHEGAIDELLDLLNGGDPAGVVLAVDDAEQLQTDALEFFRLLAAMGRGQRHRSRMVLSGAAGFADRFERPASDKRPSLIDRRVEMEMEPALEPDPLPPAEPMPAPLPRARRWPRMVTAAVLAMGAGAAGVAWQVRTDGPRVATLAADPLPLPPETGDGPVARAVALVVAVAVAPVEDSRAGDEVLAETPPMAPALTAEVVEPWSEPPFDGAAEPGPAMAGRPAAGDTDGSASAAQALDETPADPPAPALAAEITPPATELVDAPEPEPAVLEQASATAPPLEAPSLPEVDGLEPGPAMAGRPAVREEPPGEVAPASALVDGGATDQAGIAEMPPSSAARQDTGAEAIGTDDIEQPPVQADRSTDAPEHDMPLFPVPAPGPAAEPLPVVSASVQEPVPTHPPVAAVPAAPPPPAIVPPASAPPAVAPRPRLDPALLAALMRRGDALLAVGDISAARLVYGRAAAAGSGAAATALGRTWDPGYLAGIGGRGITGDEKEAASWYRQGSALGDIAAGERLRQLGQAP